MFSSVKVFWLTLYNLLQMFSTSCEKFFGKCFGKVFKSIKFQKYNTGQTQVQTYQE